MSWNLFLIRNNRKSIEVLRYWRRFSEIKCNWDIFEMGWKWMELKLFIQPPYLWADKERYFKRDDRFYFKEVFGYISFEISRKKSS